MSWLRTCAVVAILSDPSNVGGDVSSVGVPRRSVSYRELYTKAVVASVVLATACDCVGAVGLPVNAGLARGASDAMLVEVKYVAAADAAVR